ncbi:hypothetical protein T11_12621 [Trichinella zimbabwensis]|uniref:Uncharacterized protein n=1 Tax=Trichinella zimbabwensis TaxID=268475 RepID=A0A0V1I4A9_9BILA|nr:hypothetical protein T11_12621 [Trichinella zimbabwensis]
MNSESGNTAGHHDWCLSSKLNKEAVSIREVQSFEQIQTKLAQPAVLPLNSRSTLAIFHNINSWSSDAQHIPKKAYPSPQSNTKSMQFIFREAATAGWCTLLLAFLVCQTASQLTFSSGWGKRATVEPIGKASYCAHLDQDILQLIQQIIMEYHIQYQKCINEGPAYERSTAAQKVEAQ